MSWHGFFRITNSCLWIGLHIQNTRVLVLLSCAGKEYYFSVFQQRRKLWRKQVSFIEILSLPSLTPSSVTFFIFSHLLFLYFLHFSIQTISLCFQHVRKAMLVAVSFKLRRRKKSPSPQSRLSSLIINNNNF